MLNSADKRYKILFTPGSGTTINLNVALSMAQIDHFDFDEDFQNELAGVREGSINPIENGDVVKYSPDKSSYQTSTLNFIYNGVSNYLNAGFTSSDIAFLKPAFVKSNYIIQVYDSIDSANQNVQATAYINGFQILTNTYSIHTISLSKECFNIYLKQSYLDTITATTFTLYFKYLFYRAKDGQLLVFSQDAVSLINESELYFPMTFTKATRTYLYPSTISIALLLSTVYVNNVNQSITSINIEKTTYPSGNTFTSTGSYVII